MLLLAENRLTVVPSTFANLRSLRTVSLCSNHLKTFPVALCGLKNLNTLDLSRNKLAEVPDDVRGLSIVELNLNQNQARMFLIIFRHKWPSRLLVVSAFCFCWSSESLRLRFIFCYKRFSMIPLQWPETSLWRTMVAKIMLRFHELPFDSTSRPAMFLFRLSYMRWKKYTSSLKIKWH